MLILVHALDMDITNVKDYYNSFEDKEEDLNCFAITLLNKGAKSYLTWIKHYEKNFYYLIDNKNPKYIIGYGKFKDLSTIDNYENYLEVGNISYGIRPLERNKGYGKILFKLLLEKCEELGMTEVYASCLEENIASKSIIENNNGILEKRFYYDEGDKYALKYWIKLHPKVKNRVRRKINNYKNNNYKV